MRDSSPHGGGYQESLAGEVASERAAEWAESKHAGWGKVCAENTAPDLQGL